MPKKIVDIDYLALIKAINKSAEQPEKGFFTRKEFEIKWQLTSSRITGLLSQGLNSGVIEKRTYKIANINGIIKPIPHYRIKK